MERLETDINNIHLKLIYNEQGRAILGPPLKDAREARFKFLQDKKEQTKCLLAEAEQSLELERAHHFAACPMLITQQGCDAAKGNISFLVQLAAEEKEYYYYLDLISSKTELCSMPMYTTGDKTEDGKQRPNKTIKEVPVGKADQAEHIVDVEAVSIIMLPDGFGVHEAITASANTNEDGYVRSHHRLFHGHLREGAYHEGTFHTDSGVYFGTFWSNELCGRGKMKYADTTVLTGGFALSPAEDDSPLGPNPYLRGLPHGDVKIQYKGGASYEGEMRYGLITGNGIYRYPSDDA